MTKRITKVLTLLLILIISFMVSGCKDDENKARWAEKITTRYAKYQSGDAQQPFFYEDLYPDTVAKFGESNYGSLSSTDDSQATGILYWVDGGYTKEEVTQMVSKGKRLKGLAISFALGRAVDAYYGNLKGWIY